jgi:hypothetical protein
MSELIFKVNNAWFQNGNDFVFETNLRN